MAGRLARRETMRRPWRTLLVALLVAVPVAGMAVTSVWIRTDHQDPMHRWRAQYGNADLVSSVGIPKGPPIDPSGPDLETLLPEGSHVVSYRTEYLRVLRTTGGERSTPEVLDLPMTDPLVAPIVQVTSGRVPTRAGEVFLTRTVAKQLHATVGATLRLERPQRLDWTVVGVGEFRAAWDTEAVIVGPGTSFPWRTTSDSPSSRTVLVDLPDATTAEQLGVLANSPEGALFAPNVLPLRTSDVSFTASDATTAVRWSWVIGAVVLTVVGIVIAAAFAAGARRQLTTLGQLSANGASPAALRRVLFLQGTWTGLVGAILGLVFAAVALVVAAPHIDQLFSRDVDPYTVRAFDLIPIFLLGVAASTIAALIPARTTARIPVLAALAGRRPLRRVPPWLTVAGLAGVVVGLALLGLAVLGANGATGDSGNVWALTAVVGGVAVLLGACAVAPGYVSVLEPLASRVRGASRLAARSLARQRTRTGAVVSAVCATSALAIAASALVLAADARDRGQRDWMRPDEVQLRASTSDLRTPIPSSAAVPDEVAAAITLAIPNAKVHKLTDVGIPDASGFVRWDVRGFASGKPSGDGNTYVGFDGGLTPAVLADDTLLGLYPPSSRAREALDRDGIVGIIGGPLPLSGTATVALVEEPIVGDDSKPPPPPTELIAPFPLTVVAQEGLALGQLPRVWVTPARARELGLEAMAGTTVIRSPAKLTGAQRAAFQDAVDEYRDTAADVSAPGEPIVNLSSDVLYPPSGPDPRLLEVLLTGAALVLSLFVISVSLALSAAETRDERDVLAAVGASPSTMRGTSGRKALLLSILGAVLAVPVGFLPVSVFTAVSKDNLPLVFPWRVVGLLVAAVPVVVFGVATLSSGLALRLRPVHVSTMSYD